MVAKWSGVLSTTEPRNDIGIIKVRQGNINSEIAEFQIVQNNKPYNLTGLTVFFCASFGLNLVEKPAVVVNAAGGIIEYTFDDDSMQAVGRQKGYFSIKKEESKIDSTQEFEFQVESSLMTRSIDGKSYIYKLSTLIKVLDDFVKNGQKNFNVWFESVKEILYGVDPGGNILRELIEARKNSNGNIFTSLKERLDKNEQETTAQFQQIEHNVDDYIIHGPVDVDGEAIRRAVLSAEKKSVTIKFSDRIYNVDSKIEYPSNVIFKGTKGKTVIKTDKEIFQLFINKKNVHTENILFEHLIFLGGVSEVGTFPRIRESRIVSPSILRAINSYSDVNTTVENVTVNECSFLNIADLPIYLDGVKGETTIKNCWFSNCIDVGFINCDSVTFNKNRIRNSSDNGVSISRGCKKVICTENKISNCAYSGIWISGWSNEVTNEMGLGAEDFICDNNLIENCGHFGIQLTDAPKNGSVSHNTIKHITRGTYDEPNDFRGVGIKISSYPEIKYGMSEIEQMSENLIVKDNNVLFCERGGIEVRGLDTGNVSDNTVKNCGSKYLADGTTLVSQNSIEQNFGLRFYIKNKLIKISGNMIIDNRPTPLTLSPIVFLNDEQNSNTFCTIKDNIAHGCVKKLTETLRQDAASTNKLENVVHAMQNSTYPSVVSADSEGFKRVGLVKRSGEIPSIVMGSTATLRFTKANTVNVDDPSAVYTDVGYLDANGNFFANGGLSLGSDGSWGSKRHITLGVYHLWIDTTGRLRIKSSTPTSETDGTVVGSQS